MKLKILNEDKPSLDYSSIIASFFTKSPSISFALEPKEIKDKDKDDDIEDIEDDIEDDMAVAQYGRKSNFTRINTGGEDEVRGGK